MNEIQTIQALSIFVHELVAVSDAMIQVDIIVVWITEQAIKRIVAFQEALKRVHVRLISEGYLISNGVITKPADTPKININNIIQK